MPSIPPTYRLNSHSVPRSITKMAREHHLGRRRAISSNRFEIASFTSIALISLILSGELLYLSLYLLSQLYHDFSSEIGIVIVACLSLFMGIFLLFFIGAGIYRTYESIVYGWFISVYEKGCIIQKHKEAAHPFSWNEIETIWLVCTKRRKHHLPRSESFTIQCEDGHTVMLTRHGGDLNTVTKVINEHLCERLLPHLLAQYTTGQRVLFGPCGVNQEGFILGEKDGTLLPWARFARIEIKETFLLIHEQEQDLPWARVFTVTIPNLFTLMALIDLVYDNSASIFPSPNTPLLPENTESKKEEKPT